MFWSVTTTNFSPPLRHPAEHNIICLIEKKFIRRVFNSKMYCDRNNPLIENPTTIIFQYIII